MLNIRAFIFLVFIFSSFHANACKLVVHVINYPPLAIKDKNDNWSGLNFKYLDPLFKEANCKYKLFETPFARGVSLAKNGTIDLLLNISKTDEREKHLHFIGPQRIETIRLATKKGTIPQLRKWSDLEKLNSVLIWQTGAFFGDRIVEVMEKNKSLSNKLLYIADNTVMIDLIKRGRADGFFVEENFFNYKSKTSNDYKNLEGHPLIIHSENVYFAFSKKSVSPEILERFQQAYNRLVEKNVLQNISL